MKRMLAIIVGFVLVLTMVGCSTVGVETDYPAAIMVDGKIYLKSGEPMPAEVDESAIIGQTTSYTDAYPTRDGETNFNRELGTPYAKVEDGIAVLVDNEWYLCHPEQNPSPQLPYLLTGTESIEIHAYDGTSAEPSVKLIVDGWEDVDRLIRSFNTLRLEKMQYVEPSIHGYELWFRDSAGNELAYISLPFGPSPWVNFQGVAYQVTYGSIDLDYLAQLVEIATAAGPKPE